MIGAGINLFTGKKIDKNLWATMAESNCLFSPPSENPRGFSVWYALAKLSASPATTHSRDR